MIKRKKKKKGINVFISREAHKKIWEDGLKSSPPRNLREQVNIINNIPIEK